MKITNKFGLPQTIVNALERPTYSKGLAHLSATELLNSAQIAVLRKQHLDEIEVDASDMVWSLFGSAVHHILEQGVDENHLVEERIHAELDGWNISGAIDLQIIQKDGVEINDYKTVGVYGVMNEKKEWEEQLNIYAWLVEKVKKTPVTALKIVAIIRDWNRRDSNTRAGYPAAPVAILDIPLWSFDRRQEYVRSRIHAHSEALFALETGADIPPCTPEECWEKPTTYAVKKEGGVRAKIVCASEEEAKEELEKSGKGYFIETRLGERTRCANYCQVSQWCKQYQSYLQEEK
jgi:PD-(D/E)XK nuclease superfamily